MLNGSLNVEVNRLYTELQATLPPIATTTQMEDQEAQEVAFLSGATDRPQHDYPFLQSADFDVLQERVETVGTALERETTGDVTGPLYRDLIRSKLTEVSWLRLCAHANSQDASESTEDKQSQLSRQIIAHSEELYGARNTQVYHQIMGGIILRGKQESNSRHLADELEDLVGDIPSVPTLARPPESLIEKVSQEGRKYLGNILDMLPSGGEPLSPKELRTLFGRLLGNIVLVDDKTAPSWTAELSPTVRAVTPQSVTNTLLVPQNRHPQPLEGLGKLVSHEFFHVLRSMYGEISGIPALRHGTAGYMDMEEGIATAFEVTAGGDYRLSGQINYLAVSLLHEQSFRRSHDILWRARMLASGNLQDPSHHERMAYRALRRASFGTDYLPVNKDLSYVSGAMKAWEFLGENIDDPQKMQLLFARADPTNPVDREVLEAIYT